MSKALFRLKEKIEIEFLKSKTYTEINDMFNQMKHKIDKAESELNKLTIPVVSNCKRDETLELLEEIMTKVKEANEEVENGIYDPMLEVAKHILNNYKIERRQLIVANTKIRKRFNAFYQLLTNVLMLVINNKIQIK